MDTRSLDYSAYDGVPIIRMNEYQGPYWGLLVLAKYHVYGPPRASLFFPALACRSHALGKAFSIQDCC